MAITGRSHLVDLTVALHHETEKAILVSETGETMPERLAIEKGLA